MSFEAAEGFTAGFSEPLLRELGDGYAGVLAEHHRVLREVWGRHRGVEVDTAGDAFFVAFGRASDAVAAAAEAQLVLADGPVDVRMGVHAGEPMVSGEGYVGIDVHRAARIAAAGHGGQVLVSAATAALVDGSELRSLGEHRFKDLAAAEPVYQLGEREFPPINSLQRTTLPVPATPFVGRSAELAELAAIIAAADARLVTVTGPGGAGKTRLALQALGSRMPDECEGA